MWFVYYTLKKESSDKQWALIASSQPWRSKEDQQLVFAEAAAIGNAGKVRKDAWEVVDVETGIDMIGLDIKIHGEKWLETRPRMREFLEKSGVSPTEAVKLHEKWRRITMKKFGRDEKGKLLEGKKPPGVKKDIGGTR